MSKTKKRVISILLATLTCMSLFIPAFATGNISGNSRLNQERVVGATVAQSGATVEFVDSNLLNTNSSLTQGIISPQGYIHEEYDHSYYYFDHSAISQYNVGPRCNDILLMPVARGATKTLTETKQVSGTITFSSSVDAGIKKAINLGFNLSVSGTYTKTWEVDLTFTGPDAPYNSRSYYGAINYDLYSCYVKRYDVYKRYNGDAYVQDVTYYNGMSTVDNVKVPHAVEYSIDSIQ